jgi:HEAT repeat protein
MSLQRTGVTLLGAALLVAGCVDGDAPRAAAAVPAAHLAQQAPVAAPKAGEPAQAEEPAQAVPELATAMIDDPDPRQRRESVYSIADAEGVDQAAVIGQALTDPDPRVRTAAIEAMTGIEDGTAADWLSIGLGDPDPGVRRSTVEALGQIGGTSARYLLEQALGDADAGVREAAQQMLEEPAFAEPAVR